MVDRRTIEGRTKNERETIEDRSRNNRENHDPLLRFVRDPFGIRSGCSRCKESKKKLCGQEKWSRVLSSRPLKANRMGLLCKILLKYLVFMKNSRFDKILSLYILGIFRKSSYLCTPKTACYTGCC